MPKMAAPLVVDEPGIVGFGGANRGKGVRKESLRFIPTAYRLVWGDRRSCESGSFFGGYS